MKHFKGNETARMRSCVENSAELKNGNADDDNTRTETGEDTVDGKGGEIQT